VRVERAPPDKEMMAEQVLVVLQVRRAVVAVLVLLE
jgi:hypothetical protein